MHEVRIVNSIAEINREQLKDGKENSQQEINEFVHEGSRKKVIGNLRWSVGRNFKSIMKRCRKRKLLQERYGRNNILISWRSKKAIGSIYHSHVLKRGSYSSFL